MNIDSSEPLDLMEDELDGEPISPDLEKLLREGWQYIEQDDAVGAREILSEIDETQDLSSPAEIEKVEVFRQAVYGEEDLEDSPDDMDDFDE